MGTSQNIIKQFILQLKNITGTKIITAYSEDFVNKSQIVVNCPEMVKSLIAFNNQTYSEVSIDIDVYGKNTKSCIVLMDKVIDEIDKMDLNELIINNSNTVRANEANDKMITVSVEYKKYI